MVAVFCTLRAAHFVQLTPRTGLRPSVSGADAVDAGNVWLAMLRLYLQNTFGTTGARARTALPATAAHAVLAMLFTIYK